MGDAKGEVVTRGAASGSETSLFQSLAQKWTPLSDDIKTVRFRFGEASDGMPAVWITIVVLPDLKPSKQKIERLYEATERFRKEVLQSGTPRWPYFAIETE